MDKFFVTLFNAEPKVTTTAAERKAAREARLAAKATA